MSMTQCRLFSIAQWLRTTGPRSCRQQHQRCDIKACLLLDFSADLAAALDHDDGFQARPVVAFLEPLDVVDDGGGSGLDAAVIAIDRRCPG